MVFVFLLFQFVNNNYFMLFSMRVESNRMIATFKFSAYFGNFKKLEVNYSFFTERILT